MAVAPSPPPPALERAPAAPTRTDAGAGTTLTPRATLLRLVTWSALALFGAHAWAVQVDPASRGAAWGSVIAGLVVVAGLAGARRLRGRAGTAAIDGLVVVAALLALATSGIEVRLLLPDRWDVMVTGIGQGLGGLPGVRVPYRGLDEWIRVVIVLGGSLLVTLSAWLAFAPTRRAAGRPLAAATLLGVLYAVPVVERSPESPFLSGAVFAALLAAFLWADRLRPDQARLGVALAGGCLLVALLAAPSLDGRRPLLDYEQLVTDALSPANSTRFDWSHGYGPLQWPRDGREVLRVKAQRSTYWKAAVLSEFDGRAWQERPGTGDGRVDTEFAPDPDYRDRLQVVVRNLRSTEYIGAGTTLGVRESPRLVRAGATSGTWRTGQTELQRGDAYSATVYVPRPEPAELRDAGTDFPAVTRQNLTMTIPAPGGAAAAPAGDDGPRQIVFPFWGVEAPTYALPEQGLPALDGEDRVARSVYGRAYRLAQRLKSASTTPYEFVRAVRARVRRGAEYSETPPAAAVPLDAFLFEDRLGYCQQFSGAMALLLRMGGVPARVASGFTSGSYDQSRGEWVVRDIDAHSWVEVYFPGQGWVAFDPTPAGAPPRAQLVDVALDPSATEASGGSGDPGLGAGDRQTDPGIGAAPEPPGVPQQGGSTSVLPVVLAVAVTLLAVGVLVRRRRRRRSRDLTATDPELLELVRALALTGRTPKPGTTLRAIERQVAHEPGADAYVRAVRQRRYAQGGGPDRGAGPDGRAALRRALGEGLGPLGRVRAWRALPPRPRLAFRWRTRRPGSDRREPA